MFGFFDFGDSEYSNSNPITRRDIPSATPRVISPMGFWSGTTKAVKSARADCATLVMSRANINILKRFSTCALSPSIDLKDRGQECFGETAIMQSGAKCVTVRLVDYF